MGTSPLQMSVVLVRHANDALRGRHLFKAASSKPQTGPINYLTETHPLQSLTRAPATGEQGLRNGSSGTRIRTQNP